MSKRQIVSSLGQIIVAVVAVASYARNAGAVTIDFNHDGHADILWHNFASGQTQQWFMNGASRIGTGQLPSSLNVADGTGWHLVGVNDFNADTSPDLLWHNGSTGQTQIWFMNGTNRASFVQLDTSLNVADSTGWTIVGTGDFNQDGKPDILWHNGSTGPTQVWFMNGATRIGFAQTDPSLNVTDASAWHVVGVNDFDHDGKMDILWHNGMSGASQVWFMNGMSRTSASNLDMSLNVTDGTFWQVAGTDDFNGDGNADILWHNANSGDTQIWLMIGIARSSALTFPASLKTADLSGWRIADGTNVARLAVPVALPAAPTQLSVTSADSNFLNFQWRDNNTPNMLPAVGYELWEVLANTSMGVLRTNLSANHTGGISNSLVRTFDLSGGTRACIKLRAFNVAGFSMFSNVACGSGVTMPSFSNIGLGNGVLTCTTDHTDCNFFPVRGQAFQLAWSVCNNGNMTSPALDVELVTTDNTGATSKDALPLPSVGAAQCATQFSPIKTITVAGPVHFDVVINGQLEGGTGMTFF